MNPSDENESNPQDKVHPQFQAMQDRMQKLAQQWQQGLAGLPDQNDQAALDQLTQNIFMPNLAGDNSASLITELKNPGVGVRANAAARLGFLGDNAAVEPLIEALNDHEFPVRITSISALGRLKAERAVEPLLTLLRQVQPSGDMLASMQTQALVKSLTLLKDKRAVAPLQALLKEPSLSSELSEAIDQALAELGDEKANQ